MIEHVAELVAERAKQRIQSGMYKRYMPLEGLAALMADKLDRWFETREPSEIEELAVDAFMILLKSIEVDGEMGPTKTPKATGNGH